MKHFIRHLIVPASLALIVSATPAFAQSAADFQALKQQLEQLQSKVDKLQKEEADMTVNNTGTSAAAAIEENKVKLAAGVTALKLYGDLRMRYQYDQFHPELDVPPTVTDDRNRFRFRLRIGADVQIGDQFFAGAELATGQANSLRAGACRFDSRPGHFRSTFGGHHPVTRSRSPAGRGALRQTHNRDDTEER